MKIYVVRSDNKTIMCIITIYDDKFCYIRHIYQDFPKIESLRIEEENFSETKIWKQWKEKYPELSITELYNLPIVGRWSDKINGTYFHKNKSLNNLEFFKLRCPKCNAEVSEIEIQPYAATNYSVMLQYDCLNCNHSWSKKFIEDLKIMDDCMALYVLERTRFHGDMPVFSKWECPECKRSFYQIHDEERFKEKEYPTEILSDGQKE